MFDDFETDDEDNTDFSLFDDEPDGASSGMAFGGLKPPREMDSCIGHDEHESSLISLYEQGRMPHALIFAGPQGIGKATFAFRLARFLLKNGKGGEQDSGAGLFGDTIPAPALSFDMASDERVFRQVASGGHPDLMVAEIPFDEQKGRKKTGVDIETIRRIPNFMRMTASSGGWRIAIIDDADTMTTQAQNGILKILEEPPANALLILIAHRPGALVPTIRSRCRLMQFEKPHYDDYLGLLRREQSSLTDADGRTLYAMTGGSPGQSLRLIEEGGLEALARTLALFDQWPAFSWPDVHGLGDTLSKPGQEDAYSVFCDILNWTAQSLLRARAGGEALPQPLRRPVLEDMMMQYDLAQWIEICEKLTNHFDMVQYSSLDKRHGVLGAFAIFGRQKEAA